MSVADCDETKGSEDSIVKITNNYSDINIISYCIKNVEYFWMSDVIGKIINIGIDDSIKQLNQKQLMDLGYIQSDILKFCNEDIDIVDYKREVIDVRIINSFVKLLETVCNERSITISILNKSDMDGISANVVEYLKRIQIERLRIIEE